MSWHFFGTSHEKGEWDGAGAIVKQTLRAKHIHNPLRRLQDVEDIVLFFIKKMFMKVFFSYEGFGSSIIKRYF
jgi:hypothetical protein